jgi:hypothetical protein
VVDYVSGAGATNHEPRPGTVDHVVVHVRADRVGIQLDAPAMGVVPHPVAVDLDAVSTIEIDHLVVVLAPSDVVDPVGADDCVVGLAVPADPDPVAPKAGYRLVEVVVLEDVALPVDLQTVGHGAGHEVPERTASYAVFEPSMFRSDSVV